MMLTILLACSTSPPVADDTGERGETSPVTTVVSDDGPVRSVVVRQPWNANEAAFDVELTDPAPLAIACWLGDDRAEVHLVESDVEADAHALTLAGLLAEASYDCLVGPPGTPAPLEVPLTTQAPTDPGLTTIDVMLHDPRAGGDYTVTNHQREPFDGARGLVFDRDGNVRWHVRHGNLTAVSYHEDIASFSIRGGWPPKPAHRLRLVDLLGGDISFDLGVPLANAADVLFHHDARRLPDGRLLTLEERAHPNTGGEPVRSFATRLVAPDGEVRFDWHSERGYLEGHLLGRRGNSYHPNWLNLYDFDGQEVILVSLCVPSQVVAIEVPSGRWRWAFGKDGDFTLRDPDGTALDRHPECQHGLQYADGRLLVYDNGRERGYSRVVEYELDESTMTATERWTWTEDGWFETHLGGADWTTEGLVLVAIGHREQVSPRPGDHTRFLVVDPSTDEKLWEAWFPEVNAQAFRGESIDPCSLFANGRYCGAIADRVEALGPAFSSPPGR